MIDKINGMTTNSKSFLGIIKHHLFVLRGHGFKALQYDDGSYIYKESDRDLASREPLSDSEEKTKTSGLALILIVMIVLVYLLTTSFIFTISTIAGSIVLAIGVSFFSRWLGLFVICVSILLHLA